MSVIDRLRDVDVQDTDGQKVRLGDLWQEQPIVALDADAASRKQT